MSDTAQAKWPCECQEIGTCLFCLMRVTIKREYGEGGVKAIAASLAAERQQVCEKLEADIVAIWENGKLSVASRDFVLTIIRQQAQAETKQPYP